MRTQQLATTSIDLITETILYATKVDEILSLQLSDGVPDKNWLDNALQVIRTLTEVRTALLGSKPGVLMILVGCWRSLCKAVIRTRFAGCAARRLRCVC
jgi:hypothetical protein